MSRMCHRITIDRPPEAVLAYASSATRWPEWHPSSLRVEGASGPLPSGARFEEDVRAGGREGHLVWTVLEADPGRRWVARAEGDRHGLRLVLTYACTTAESGTRFERTLDYTFEGWGMRLLDRLVLRRRIDRESAGSLVLLKRTIEAGT